MSKKPSKKKITAYGYTSQWMDGSLGWNTTPYLYARKNDQASRKNASSSMPKQNCLDESDRLYLCKFTIEPVLDKKGRFITKIPRKEN